MLVPPVLLQQQQLLLLLSFFLLFSLAHELPVRVFILAGQSNMQGQGSIEMLQDLMENDLTRPVYRHLVDDQGNWVVLEDVKIYYPATNSEPQPLSVGFGSSKDRFGPELEFGRIVANLYDGPTLLVKAAWGGMDLAVDFRPPSQGINNYTTWEPGPLSGNNTEDAPIENVSHYSIYYHKIVDVTNNALSMVEQGMVFKDVTTWELKGLVWWQGFNDLVYDRKVYEYEENLKQLIRDLRKDLNQTNLPFVIGELGQWGIEPINKQNWLANRIVKLRKIQRAVPLSEEFRETTRSVPTAQYYVEDPVNHYDGDYHYNGRADSFFHIGRAFGMTMVELLEDVEALDNESEETEE